MPSLPFIARASDKMMATVVARTTQVIKPHVPLIKFPPRNAGPSTHNISKGVPSQPFPNPAQQTPVSNKTTSKGPAIESSTLPPKYHRKPLSQEEMEYIEKGGPV